MKCPRCLHPRLVLALLAALHTGEAKVFKIDVKNFMQRVTCRGAPAENPCNWFIAFTSASCKHCKRLKPIWEKLSVELQGRVFFGEVDMDAEKGLVYSFNVNKSPDLKLFINHGEMVYDFPFQREEDPLRQFALGAYDSPQLRDRVTKGPIPTIYANPADTLVLLNSMRGPLLNTLGMTLGIVFGLVLGMKLCMWVCLRELHKEKTKRAMEEEAEKRGMSQDKKNDATKDDGAVPDSKKPDDKKED